MTCSLLIFIVLLLALLFGHSEKLPNNGKNGRPLICTAILKNSLRKKRGAHKHILTNEYTHKCINKKRTHTRATLFIQAQHGLQKSNIRFSHLYVRGSTNVKPKTNKSIAKRFKITKNGKLIRKKAGRNHMLRKKTSSNKASLRKTTTIASSRIVKKYKSAIHT
ncbi:50s ribosomal protein l35, putative [Plasmodium knowlesi strain H]|uniref:50S ribosomal protein L35 n=3 Tax=Plasmodium knowlesi TaxID=5850 RepID=A0A5K1UMU2_PLAKH|nr:ribosomal protein L35, apicoplast, putative [Plasmodium knowlesi strain H]OTN67455.1 50S ribosomal protein L35 [Plasmodium knowlesi]CAA9987346.1 ribosomal protein L35, apicoplast, putative [Plasmodium knowlesi strain H]SBO23369.1 50s ribosomal protein l35, putative [Plasmodium knowlesi strain H]SBO24562.1 50s ribosomal protein l35, putative [Plasmodium knowlesi strain H]VVS76820.1 ribosomal protein L35, apicoplast, putative [Plasmodium knowlesi strain H]|eukprot:XP_002258349.1 50s ribosomal protein l35, putative [Plasmodium knowlesi strain H]